MAIPPKKSPKIGAGASLMPKDVDKLTPIERPTPAPAVAAPAAPAPVPSKSVVKPASASNPTPAPRPAPSPAVSAVPPIPCNAVGVPLYTPSAWAKKCRRDSRK